MAFNLVSSDFDTCTLHRILPTCFSPFPDSHAGPHQPSWPLFTLCNALVPLLLPLETLICSRRGILWSAIQEAGRWGKEWVGGHKRAALFISLVSQAEGKGSPWKKEARTFHDPVCPHPHWVSSLLTSPGQYLGGQWLGWCRAGWTLSHMRWFVAYFVEHLYLAAQWDWQKNNTFDMLFYLSTFCHDILWCKFLILLQLSAALAVTAQGQQWG